MSEENKLRKAIRLSLVNTKLIAIMLTNDKKDINTHIEFEIDDILDALTKALPEKKFRASQDLNPDGKIYDITYINGYNKALEDITAILQAAKGKS